MSKTIRKNKPKKHAKLNPGKGGRKSHADEYLDPEKADGRKREFKKSNVKILGQVGRPRRWKTREELISVLQEYFDSVPWQIWTVTGLALHIGASKQLLIDYEKREEFADVVKEAKLIVENAYEISLRIWGRTGDIFALKNFGWADTVKQEHSGPNGGPMETINRASAEAQELIDKHGPYGDEPAEPKTEAPPETSVPSEEQGS